MTAALVERREWLADLRRALDTRTGYAAGKIGTSEKHWLLRTAVHAASLTRIQRVAFEAAVAFHCRSSGVFPLKPDFYDRFAAFHAGHTAQLDCLGVTRDLITLEDAVLDHYRFPAKLVHFLDQEPDRSVPTRPDLCYLPSFEGLRVLLICPFASLLKTRATQETFEAVWSRTGKRWFYPASVDAIDVPYGFLRATQARFPTVIDLHAHLADEMSRREFDVALIAASGLGIPLASTAKSLGKIGISLGGHLQVLFGVAGQRWRDQPEWRDRYFTDAWIDMPPEYRPEGGDDVCDQGAYW